MSQEQSEDNNGQPETEPEPQPQPQPSLLENILFRNVCPTDLPAIYNLERSSYPKNEAASKSQIQYRQHHAAPFFRCAVYIPPEELGSRSIGGENCSGPGVTNKSISAITNQNHSTKSCRSLKEIGTIIGFVTATRCSYPFTEKSMSTHEPNGNILAIHSVVVEEKYRNMGIGQAMVKNYLHVMGKIMEEKIDASGNGGERSSTGSGSGSGGRGEKLIEEVVLLSKITNIPFYVKLGFQVQGKSEIVHGHDDWYDCVKPVEVVKKNQLRQKGQLSQQEFIRRNYGSVGNCLCWIIDGFAIPIHHATKGPELGVTRSNSGSDTKSDGNSGIVNSGGGGNSSGGNNVISYKKGSGNPAAVVIVPNATPTKRINRAAAPNASLNLGTIATTASNNVSNPNDAENFDPTFEDNYMWMKNIAKEFNLSETAFVWRHRTENGDEDGCVEYNIRFYTCNGTEIDLCGHATLAASSVIFQQIGKEMRSGGNNHAYADSNVEEITFHANNNIILKAKRNRNAGHGSTSGHNLSRGVLNQQNLKIVMEFPTKSLNQYNKGTEEYAKAVLMLKEAFAFQDDTATADDFDIEDHVEFIGLDETEDDLLIELSSEGFSNIPRYGEDINYKAMVDLHGYNRGIIICCEVSEDYRAYGESAHFMSRFFGPKVGIEEDPVTGSAHCILGPYYSNKLGKTCITGTQKSLRGGIVECRMKENGLIQLAGTAVTRMTGHLHM